MDFEAEKFYGTTTVGEKGQVVLPVDLRRKLKIETGEKLAVLVVKQMGIVGIMMVKSEILTSIIEDIFGGRLGELIETKKETKKPKNKRSKQT